MPSIDPHIFRAYDIRGKAHTQVSAEACTQIGYAFGETLKEMYDLPHPRVAVGRDARTHGPELQSATIDGLTASGCEVIDIGQTPSPVNYFTVCTEDLDGSIQITASHNHKDDNGLKLQVRDAVSFCGENIQKLRERIEKKNFIPPLSSSLPKGERTAFDAVTPYIEHLSKMFADKGQGLHVVIDGGNGVAGPCYTQILKNIGCTVTELYTDPDGEFPNHPADPSKWDTLKDLQKKVTEKNADIGLAFDGDGDRLGIVDEKGQIRTADEILLLLSKDHLSRHEGSAVIFTVSSSSTLETEITTWGGKPVMSIVGHAFVEHTMKEHNSLLGGEQSGHFFCFEDYHHFDDALVAGLHAIRILTEEEKTLSQLFDAFPTVYQAPEMRPHCPDEHKTRIVKEITNRFIDNYLVNTDDGVRVNFGDYAWAGIRQSNTSPCLSVCMEARDPQKLKEIETIVMEQLQQFPEVNIQ
jgi:phosphomannomutase / phosphoglucomutase